MTTSAKVDQYLATLPADARDALEKVRRTIRSAAPDAVEVMAYGMPGFKYQGRPLIYIGAAKNHCALYGPAVVEHQDELAGYDTSKGTIRFPSNKPLPAALVRKLVKARIVDIKEEEKQRKARKAGSRKGK
jgi:uncharacterized protein YdhG (YjbR/CyaY superfamily)